MKNSIIVFSLASLLLLAGNAYAFDPLFYARIDYGTGDDPLSVFAADLDGNSDSDLPVANTGSDNVSIVMNGQPNQPVRVGVKIGYRINDIFNE